ncbi:DUF1097 domain-containing protein [Polaribacter sargassicola]|uniref:DUF1097 domain-containing protein n=1 Tax=Polaribacter sargassicola TaxID=2836891 RepID=UPI001F1A630A|nr:DUF1097 domain-containing protein [Polaribacter sp. DS7-9]MCG1037058.1 DUF1097 family protein [Polaribacter sp. DS7-9]
MKQFLSAITMAILGALAVFLSTLFNLPTWALFLSWLSYYLFGKTLKSALYTLIPITAGIIMAIITQTLGDFLGKYFGFIGFPIAVFICITLLNYLAQIKLLSNISAWFVGLIIFFGIHPTIEFKEILNIFIPIFIGLLFAFLNDTTTIRIQKNKIVLK